MPKIVDEQMREAMRRRIIQRAAGEFARLVKAQARKLTRCPLDNTAAHRLPHLLINNLWHRSDFSSSSFYFGLPVSIPAKKYRTEVLLCQCLKTSMLPLRSHNYHSSITASG